MREWDNKELGTISLKIGSGATPRGGSNSYKESGISLIRSQNVLDFQFTTSGLAFIDQGQANNLSNVEVLQNDILLNITGDSVARCCIVPNFVLPARVNQHVAIIRPDAEKADHLFVFYQLQFLKDELLMQAEIGATRRALTKAMVEALEIPIPPLPEQKAIAAVLSSLDDKIDLLQRQNQTLEALAQTLFRQWFVEEAQEEWEEKPISFFGDVVCGKTPSKKIHEYFGGEIPFIKIPDMHGNTFVFETSDYLTELGKNSQVKKTIPPRSISVSCIATVGLVTMNAFESHTNQQINSIVPYKDGYRYFLYLMMNSLKAELIAMASGGTATLNLNTGNFSRIEIINPPEDLLIEFYTIVEPLFEKIFHNQDQIRTLENLRDTLLPKLMSGEVRVRL
ncbi:MAG: restriction endonuclease subunit S [Anaerolineales bacterium]|nr:restriction endonuclease subunit S [Anaerolineales bacterium]